MTADGRHPERLWTRSPGSPPTIAPIGIVPQTMNRIVAFIRPCIDCGVIAWRRLTWLML